MASPSISPCAACKFLRRKCLANCGFAAYFPPDQPQKFINVHKVFGASNVTKMLKELQPHHREDAVNSLVYEAEMRLRDPVYGCVGVISLLQRQLRQLQTDLSLAGAELSKYQMVGISGHGGNLLGGGVGTRVTKQEEMDMTGAITCSLSPWMGQLNGFQPSAFPAAAVDRLWMPVDPS